MTGGRTDPPGEGGPGPTVGSRRGAAARSSAVSPAGEELPDLDFSIEGVGVRRHAAVPTLEFDLRVDAGEAEIRSLSLNVTVRIVATGRSYDDGERERLFELFGAPREWGRSLRALVWSQTTLVMPPFEGVGHAALSIPCSYDFDVAAHKYLHALREGEIPLEFLFSGSVYYRGPGGALRTIRLSWDKECRFDMPGGMWHEVMDAYFPNSAWLRVRRDLFDRLLDYRSSRGHPTWEATLDDLLPSEPGGPTTPEPGAAGTT